MAEHSSLPVCILPLPAGWAREREGRQQGVQLLKGGGPEEPSPQALEEQQAGGALLACPWIWFVFKGLISAYGGELSSCEIKL